MDSGNIYKLQYSQIYIFFYISLNFISSKLILKHLKVLSLRF